MNTQRLVRQSLAGAIALALFGVAAIAAAQTSPPQQFYPGTESSVTYPPPADSHGSTLTVVAGMPNETRNYGPPPSFASLDTNHDGRISKAEARAYPPLDSDFLFASNEGNTISRAQYTRWVNTQQ